MGQLDFEVLARVMIWWFVSPMVGFWLSLIVARWFHEPVLERLRDSRLLGPTRMKALVVGLGCYMGFASGDSNVANATAPLVGGGLIDLWTAVLVGGLSIGNGVVATWIVSPVVTGVLSWVFFEVASGAGWVRGRSEGAASPGDRHGDLDG